jgi:Transglycosylase-like domain
MLIPIAVSALFSAGAAFANVKAQAAGAFAALPRWWIKQALCIHRHESIQWHRTTDWLGYPSVDHGGMQIAVGTWLAYAPRAYPRDPAPATPGQQLVVAHKIWLANGDRWGGNAWPNSSVACGLE